jgi:hypothetical protein
VVHHTEQRYVRHHYLDQVIQLTQIDKMVTAGYTNMRDLGGEFLSIEEVSMATKTIHLIDPAGRSYYLNAAQCKTWFVSIPGIRRVHSAPNLTHDRNL